MATGPIWVFSYGGTTYYSEQERPLPSVISNSDLKESFSELKFRSGMCCEVFK